MHSEKLRRTVLAGTLALGMVSSTEAAPIKTYSDRVVSACLQESGLVKSMTGTHAIVCRVPKARSYTYLSCPNTVSENRIPPTEKPDFLKIVIAAFLKKHDTMEVKEIKPVHPSMVEAAERKGFRFENGDLNLAIECK